MSSTVMRDDQHTLRCPDALLRARKVIQRFLKDRDCCTLQILAIEPSLERDIRYAIKHEDWKLDLSVTSQPIPATLLQEESDDDDVFEGITTLQLFQLAKIS